MGHRATLIAVIVFAAMACGSSHNSNTEPDASLLGSGGSGFTTGSGGSNGSSSGSGGTSSNGTGNGSGSGGSAAAGSGGTGSNAGGMMTGTGGFGGFNRDGGTPMMLVCPDTQPMDGDMCMGGGFGGFGRGMSCMFGDTSCRCRRGMWRCYVPMPPPENDAGM